MEHSRSYSFTEIPERFSDDLFIFKWHQAITTVITEAVD